ncbi:AAA family ATPase [Sorangium sp. So ce1151]|uniref:AAA family ATPase n=1 Tax=Sorangium sp. So ce1151 TaxID=3133332 RepID=UPI003F62D01F
MHTQRSPLLDLSASPAGHFKLYFLSTVFHVIEQAAVSWGSADALLERFPFLTGYLKELLLPADRPDTFWPDALRAFEARVSAHLPLRALRETAGLDHRAMTLLFAVGLVEEDARFGELFDAVQDAAASLRRPTLGLLNAWWREPVDGGEVRACVRRLRELGLVHVVNPEAPRIEWALHVPALLWDAIRGETPESPAPGVRFIAPASLPLERTLLLPDAARERIARVPALLGSGEARAVVIRGPRRNGRRTVLRAVARALGRSALEISGSARPDDDRWRALGTLATLLHALPILTFDLAPGETAELPALPGQSGPLGVALGKQGGVAGPGAEGAIAVTLPMPDPAARRRHWEAGLDGQASDDLDAIAGRFRMTSGNVRRAASLARSYAALRGASSVGLADVRDASRALNRQALDTLATRLDAEGSFASLAVSAETLHDLDNLVARCRNRERLHEFVGEALRGQVGPGVRALFQGPSGTGKTLAAKILAAELGMDLYRIELASVVSKFIGETEKNLGQIFALAEELDIVLLLDEGDSLLTQRTAVQTSNDRYANLETNYLLQRIESFEGILVITTNAGELIDSAFQRRMDVVVDFRAPEPTERLRIWHLHLPDGHAVEATMLRDLAARCALSGGQIKNAVLHASLLALGEGRAMGTAHVEAAVQREYRKTGGVYPLRRRSIESPGPRS